MRHLRLSGTSLLAAALLALTPAVASAQVGANDIALGKAAFQSSNYDSGHSAAEAVDGITDGNYSNGNIAVTNFDYRGWWFVDLGGDVDISSITLWNRTDCCDNRLSGFFLSVLADGTPQPEVFNAATVWSTLNVGAIGVSATYTPAPGTIGRYVKVQFDNKSEYLQIAEVDVEGSAAVVATPEPASILLVATGLVGGVLVRRRRKA